MKPPPRPRPIAGTLLGLPLAASASWIGYSALFIPHRLPLPPAVSGARRDLTSNAGQLSYYSRGPAAPSNPLLLIHSVNAAASAYEVRPLYEHYCKTRTVYALELPGFGFSERSDRAYTPRLMTDAILAMALKIAAAHGGAAIDALALSLSSEFLARAAAENPAAFRSIALVSPTGFSRDTPQEGTPGHSRAMPALRRIFSFPLWSRALFDLLTSKPSIRFFLQKTWGSKEIDEGLLEYDYLATHQPGAQYAPYFFVSGFLFSFDIRRIYRSMPHPVWVMHGVRGDFTDFSGTRAFEAMPNWKIETFPTGALPHFETLREFNASYDAFLESTLGCGGRSTPEAGTGRPTSEAEKAN
jgi:alpha-beta hydrolase superfamily lysophospholipase